MLTRCASGLQTSTARLGIESAHPTPPPATEIHGDFDLAKTAESGVGQDDAGDILPAETRAKEVDGEEQVSAADYNPDEDRKVDDRREQELMGSKQKEVASGVGEPGPDILNVKDEESEYEEVEVDAEEDDDFDMFALDEAPKKKVVRRKKQVSGSDYSRPLRLKLSLVDLQKEAKTNQSQPTAMTSMDNYDDHEGYYRITPGEIMDEGRYKITVNLGKGMFAQVIRATVLKSIGDGPGEKEGQEVAIKVIRSQESM
jgi:serine/threonine-protein kinase PRP4